MKPIYFFLTIFIIVGTAFTVTRCGGDHNPVTPVNPDGKRCVQIGTPMLAGHTYAWSPTTDLESPFTAQTLACPKKSTVYTLTATTQCGKAASSVKVRVMKVNSNGQLVEVTQ